METLTQPWVAVPAAEERKLAAWKSRLAALLESERAAVALLGLLAIFLLFWRLVEPPKYIYDEVYHAFTGNLMQQNDPNVYEWWKSAQPNPIPGVQYEWTHPPLGKLIIGASIKLWGNNSLGWRFGNAFWGVGCVLLLYLLVRQLFNDRKIALLAGVFLLIDGLMFAEARIGTNDIYQLGFLLAAYNFFVYSLRHPARDGIAWLFATGLLLGLAFATKWPAVFSVGLMTAIAALRAFWPERAHSAEYRVLTAESATLQTESEVAAPRLWTLESGPRSLESRFWTSECGPRSLSTASGAPDSRPRREFGPQTPDSELGARHSALGTQHSRWGVAARAGYLASAVVALVALPVAIYMLSYLQMYLQPHQIPREYAEVGPLHVGPITLGPAMLGSGSWWDMFLGEQWQMWHYHTTLHDNHPYYSKWWQWLFDIRPVYYYVNRANGIVAHTYALGNPIMYWVFPLAIMAGLVFIWKRRQAWLALVMGAFLINWVPWSRSPRGLFFYHFLPSVPFLVTLLAYGVVALWRQPHPLGRKVAAWYVAAVCISFAFFYTQLSAWPVPDWYANIHFWLPSWQ